MVVFSGFPAGLPLGTDGIVNAKVVAAEGGMLAFIMPSTPLLSATGYTVRIAGAVDVANQSVAYAEFSFSTAGGAPGSVGDEDWTPSSDWKTHREPSKYELMPDLQAQRGSTALAGQVLKLNGEPLAARDFGSRQPKNGI